MGYQLWLLVSFATALWCVLVYIVGEFELGRNGIGAKNPLNMRRRENPIGFWVGIAVVATVSIVSGVVAVQKILELHHLKL